MKKEWRSTPPRFSERKRLFIYLDESGDLGFDFGKKKTTRKFVITILVCHNQKARKAIRNAVRRTLKNKLNTRKSNSRVVSELKGTRTGLRVKEYFFKAIKNHEWGIYTLVLNKGRVEPHLRTPLGKKKLYNFLSRFILEKLRLGRTVSNVDLTVDRCKNTEEVWDFNRYLVNHLEASLPLTASLNISHQTSQETPELQAVDLFCWGIFRKYEFGDPEWYRVFRAKIRYETEYLRG